jgi:hypothetical protein
MMSFATSSCVTFGSGGAGSAYCLTAERPSHTEAEIMAADRETLIRWNDELDRWRVLCE